MKGDCEAETFEEAFRKNEHRLAYERGEAASLREAMLKDGENPQGIDPEFWDGCILANKKCWEIWSARRGKDARETSAEIRRLEAPADVPKPFASGHGEFVRHWADAIDKNHPATVVYW